MVKSLKILDEDFLSSSNNFYKFLGILFAFKLIYLLFIPITPQEAYYWYYSQNPDMSYFDHPPMAAYSIWVGTNLFGDNVFGVKFMAVVWYLLTSILLYKTVSRFAGAFLKEINQYSLSFLSVIIYNLTLFAHIYSITIVPDTPLMFFWLLIIYSVQELIITGKRVWWLLAGVGLGLGLVSKYPAIIIVGSIFLFFLFSKKHRGELLSPYPYLAVIIGLLIFSPVIYWNASRGWASFLFQSTERASSVSSLRMTYILQLIASQLFMLTPLIFIFLFKSFRDTIGNWEKEEALHLFFWSAFVIIFGFALLSLTTLVKMNWLLPGFIPLTAIIAILYYNKFITPNRWIKAGYAFSIFLILIGHLIFIIPNVPLGNGNTWSGWENSAKIIFKMQQEYGGNNNCFIFTNGYKSASLLKFHLPDQQDTYAENIYGKRALQFDYWSSPNQLIGKDALYIRSDRSEYSSDLDIIKQHFENVTELEVIEYKFFTGQIARRIYCYYAENYKGPNR